MTSYSEKVICAGKMDRAEFNQNYFKVLFKSKKLWFMMLSGNKQLAQGDSESGYRVSNLYL